MKICVKNSGEWGIIMEYRVLLVLWWGLKGLEFEQCGGMGRRGDG